MKLPTFNPNSKNSLLIFIATALSTWISNETSVSGIDERLTKLETKVERVEEKIDSFREAIHNISGIQWQTLTK